MEMKVKGAGLSKEINIVQKSASVHFVIQYFFKNIPEIDSISLFIALSQIPSGLHRTRNIRRMYVTCTFPLGVDQLLLLNTDLSNE